MPELEIVMADERKSLMRAAFQTGKLILGKEERVVHRTEVQAVASIWLATNTNSAGYIAIATKHGFFRRQVYKTHEVGAAAIASGS